MIDKGNVMGDLHQKNQVNEKDPTLRSNVESEYITLEEAVKATGYDPLYLRNLAKAAGMTRIGRNSFLRDEFFFYWKFRSQESDKPRQQGEGSKQRINRVNLQWRVEYGRVI